MDFALAGGTIGRVGSGREDLARKCSSAAQKNELKPWQVKEWVIPETNADYVCAMEAVLDVYEREYRQTHPVVAIDESPRQLISQTRQGFIDSKGARYEDYEYRREGVVDLYLICEPLTGQREIFVKDNHNRLNWAEMVRFVAEEMYGEATCITIICDNLAAHKPSALYEILPADRARRILRRIEFVHTPNTVRG